MDSPDLKNRTDTSKPIVTLTDAAAVKVHALMEKEGKQDHGLRFGVMTGGCAGLSYDMRLQKNHFDNDIVFEDHGIKVFVNQESVEFVTGIVIDYVDTLKESGFKYRNPNAKGSCGCGTSFN